MMPIDQLRTTDEWWLEVSSCPTRMIAWLKSQYYGETTAVDRVLFLISHYNVTGKNKLLLRLSALGNEFLKHRAL